MAAIGDVLMQWDDDDWYEAGHLSRQVAPLAEGRADITALEMRWIANFPAEEFWAVSPQLHRRMFYCDVHGSTLAFTRSVWAAGVRYPENSWAEDAGFLYNALSHRARLLRITNDDLFVYVRHRANTWTFPIGRYLDPSGWGRTQAPGAFEAELLSRYQKAARDLE